MKKPRRGLRGSGAEKVFMDLNGVKQGMFVHGPGQGSPVLLHLHGGLPEYFLNTVHPSGLDRFFTVVWWEQRGSGLSYQPAASKDSITVEQLLDDVLALSDFLRHRFRQEKIYLLAHSGGTFLGIQAASRAPELYEAYIGVAQISDQLHSEVLAYRYMLAECRKRGLARMARQLEQCPVTREDGIPSAYLRIRDKAMHRLGVGTMRTMTSVISGLFLPSLRCPDYTPIEKVQLWRAKAAGGVSVVWDTILSTDLSQKVQELAVPAYFFHGEHDYTCSYPLARAYFEKLTAPSKGFYSFKDSAHSPIFEEPGRVQQIVREDILRGRNLTYLAG